MIITGLSLRLDATVPIALAATNAAQCDRFAVVGLKDDIGSLSACRSLGLRFVPIPSGGREFGIELDAALAGGLRHARACASDTDEWIVILPPGVIVPPDFRKRLHSLRSELHPETIYCIRQERLCIHAVEFNVLRDTGRWDRSRVQSEIAHHVLFVLSLRHPRFDEYESSGALPLDEACTLPFIALRGPQKWVPEIPEAAARNARHSRPAFFPDSAANDHGCLSSLNENFDRDAHVVVTGIEDLQVASYFARRFANVYLEDSQNVGQLSNDRLVEADRDFRWRKASRELRQLDNLFLLKKPNGLARPWNGKLSESGEKMADFLFIADEPSYHIIIEKLSRWLQLLKPNGVIGGIHYGFPRFPQTTSAIELLLGSPDSVDESGIWTLRMTSQRTERLARLQTGREHQAISRGRMSGEERGIVLFVFDRAEAKLAVTALHVLRKVWSGEICVIQWGTEEPALRVFCELQRTDYLPVELLTEEDDGQLEQLAQTCVNREVARLALLNQSPFPKTLWLRPDSQIPDVAAWLDRLSESNPFVIDASSHSDSLGTFACLRDTDVCRKIASRFLEIHRSREPISSFDAILGEAADTKVVCMSNGQRSELLCSEVEAADLLRQLSPRVWLPERTVVVTVVTPEDIDVLRHNWNAIRWPEDTKRIVYLDDIDPQTPPDFFPNGCEIRAIDPRIKEEFQSAPHWTWAIVAAGVSEQTEGVLYVDPYLTASPGAQLFCDERCQRAPYSSPGWCFLPLSQGARKIAKIGPPATLLHTSWLRTALDRYRKERPAVSFEVFLYDLAIGEGREIPVLDVLTYGWNA